MAPSSQDADRRELWRLAGLGFTLTSEVVGGALLGWGLDVLFKTTPIFIVTMTLLGVGVAMTGFIRNALRASASAGRRADALVSEGRAQPLKPVPGDRDGDGEPDPPDDAASDPESHAAWRAGQSPSGPAESAAEPAAGHSDHAERPPGAGDRPRSGPDRSPEQSPEQSPEEGRSRD